MTNCVNIINTPKLMSFWNINEIYITCVTVWGIEHNTILQFYTLLFNNPVLRLNHCSFTTINVHYIRLQHRASPEPQSPEPGLSPGISNPPNRASGNYPGSRAGPCPVLLSSPEPGFPPESLKSPRTEALRPITSTLSIHPN